MTKDELLRIIGKLLQPDGDDLDFLMKLDADELVLLIRYIRERVEGTGGK